MRFIVQNASICGRSTSKLLSLNALLGSDYLTFYVYLQNTVSTNVYCMWSSIVMSHRGALFLLLFVAIVVFWFNFIFHFELKLEILICRQLVHHGIQHSVHKDYMIFQAIYHWCNFDNNKSIRAIHFYGFGNYGDIWVFFFGIVE